MNDIFDEIETELSEKEEKQNDFSEIIIPEAYQIRSTLKSSNGDLSYEIVDTYKVDKNSDVLPDNKAKSKAKRLSELTGRTHYVVEIYHKIIATY